MHHAFEIDRLDIKNVSMKKTNDTVVGISSGGAQDDTGSSTIRGNQSI